MRALGTAGLAAIAMVFSLAVASFGAPVLCRLLPASHRDPLAQDFDRGLTGEGLPVAPGREYLLGSDMLGRDELVRLLYGGRASLVTGATAALAALGIGGTLGMVAGLSGGIVDTVLMCLTDAVLALPYLLLCIAVSAVWGGGLGTTVAVLSVVSWTGMARVVRAKVLSLRESEHLLAARALGAGPIRLLLFHVVPHVAGTALTLATLGTGAMIVAEATLSFLGVGLPPPTPAWGSMLAAATPYARTAPWLIVAPATAIFVTTLAFHLLGEALGRHLDPREAAAYAAGQRA